LIPVLFGIIGGRIFCGWFCPFGTLSRLLQKLRNRFPFARSGLNVPRRRTTRWVVLISLLTAGVGFSNSFLYLSLPHLVMQQTVYDAWLLGGGGSIVGVFLGLVAAGLILGPGLYCSTVCPTGAAFNLLGRKRLARVQAVEKTRCGPKCTLCYDNCWLALDPSDFAGPDCDLCCRCFEHCPVANLEIATARGGS
jgi:ferredoxin-type protein NapH